jgi:hypothetical protein
MKQQVLSLGIGWFATQAIWATYKAVAAPGPTFWLVCYTCAWQSSGNS